MNLTLKIVKETDNFTKLQFDQNEVQPTASKPFPHFLYIDKNIPVPEQITVTVVK